MKSIFLFMLLFSFNGLLLAQITSLRSLYKNSNSKTRSISPENITGEKGKGGMAKLENGTASFAARYLGQGWKVNPYIHIQPGESITLGEIKDSGIINHIWMTPVGDYRLLILRIYWDDETNPSVEVPVGDFFASGWGNNNEPTINSIPICVNPKSGFNSYWQMPFRNKCKITMENLSSEESTLYYQIDYSLEKVEDDAHYFHAQFRRVNTLPYKGIYTVVDGIKGKGQYVGTYIAHGANSYGWWGEGEIKFYMDGDKEYPTICGTGEEDYFCGSYCYEEKLSKDGKKWSYKNFSSLYAGFYHVKYDGEQRRFGQYRWHITDPVRFDKDLRITLQSLGWNKDGSYLPLEDDLASVAYWYQKEPHSVFPKLPTPQELIINTFKQLSGFEKINKFIDKANIEICAGNPKSIVRYTIDGSEPNLNSIIYKQPFEIIENTKIRAAEYTSEGYIISILNGEFTKTVPLESTEIEKQKYGLKYNYYNLDRSPISTSLLKEIEHSKNGIVKKIKYPKIQLDKIFGLSFDGYIAIPKTGVYKFTLISNDGSKLFLDNKMLIDNDGTHGIVYESNQEALSKGFHLFRLDYFQAGGGKELKIFIEGPDLEYQEISKKMYFH